VALRSIKLKPNRKVEPCPKCGNNTKFTAHSQQFSEDCCEGWLECACGFDPTDDRSSYRFEHPMSGLASIPTLFEVWNQLILEAPVSRR
jgi:hypothetical protein